MRASPFPCKNVIVRRWESALYSTLCCCGALTNRRAVFSSLLVLRPNESGWFNPRSRVKRVIRSAHQHADTNSIANQKNADTVVPLVEYLKTGATEPLGKPLSSGKSSHRRFLVPYYLHRIGNLWGRRHKCCLVLPPPLRRKQFRLTRFS